jgi:hypothetical protein
VACLPCTARSRRLPPLHRALPPPSLSSPTPHAGLSCTTRHRRGRGTCCCCSGTRQGRGSGGSHRPRAASPAPPMQAGHGPPLASPALPMQATDRSRRTGCHCERRGAGVARGVLGEREGRRVRTARCHGCRIWEHKRKRKIKKDK